ncbi:MAG: alpha/beta hydrolase [Burkholderiaceae bacterium]|jgi:epoxide hydrolase 4|nr:alpha/beta hydrolase [Burkholderiaceae bacterium]
MKQQSFSLSHGITLDCRIAGAEGRPVMLFLHGFPEAAFVWDEMLAFFSDPAHGGYLCVAPNLRGYAGSSAPSDVAAYRAKHLVQDLVALKDLLSPQQPLACLVAHDWGGAVAWNMANQHPELMRQLAIINSPHPGTFLRELQSSPEQQAASAYMNFLIRPDAEVLLAEDDYRRLWAFFTNMGAVDGPYAWLTEDVKAQYREVWSQGLTGALNYYRASPLRPPREADAAAAAITLPKSMLEILVPTLVLWGMNDIALPPGLVDGLEDYIPDLRLQRIADGSHWLVHEQPALVAQSLLAFLHKT